MLNIEMQYMIQQEGKKTSYYCVTYNYDGTGKLSLTSYGMVFYPDNGGGKRKIKIGWGSVASKEFNDMFLSVEFHRKGPCQKKSHIFKMKDKHDFDTIQHDLALRLENTDLSTVKLDNCATAPTSTSPPPPAPPDNRRRKSSIDMLTSTYIRPSPESLVVSAKKKKQQIMLDYYQDDFPSQSFEESMAFTTTDTATTKTSAAASAPRPSTSTNPPPPESFLNDHSTASLPLQYCVKQPPDTLRKEQPPDHNDDKKPQQEQWQLVLVNEDDQFNNEEQEEQGLEVAVFNDKEEQKKKRRKPRWPSTIPNGFSLVDLDANIYSLIFTSPITSVGFWFAITICAFQTLITILAIFDSTDMGEENPLRIPPGNDVSVIIAQGMLMFVLPHMSEAMMGGLEFLIDGYHPEVLDVCPNGTQWKWALAGILHFSVGALMMFTVFFLLLQQTSVIELGLVFIEWGFFSEIDNLAFMLGEKGVCSVALRNDIEHVENCKIIKRDTYTWSRRIRDSLLSGGLLVGWGVFLLQQESGKFLCENIFVQLGDIFNPRIVKHSGMFDSLGIQNQHDGRVVYEERGMGRLRLAYCLDIERWTMTEITNGGEFKPCGSDTVKIIAWSEVTASYSILETTDQWRVDPIDDAAAGEGYQPFIQFHMACNECSKECGGQCDAFGNCICQEGRYGVNCEYPPPCSVLVLNRKTTPFTPENMGQLDFPKRFEMLTFQDGSNKTRTDSFQVEYRPVYFGEDVDDDANDEEFLLFFTGRRWVITQTEINGVWLDKKQDVVDYMSSPDFNLMESKFEPYFASEVMDVDEPSNHDTPARLRWYYVRKNGYNDDRTDTPDAWWEVAEDEPAGDTSFNCAFCDWDDNPCEHYGQCQENNNTCWCPPGFVGALCEHEVLCTEPIDDNPREIQGCVFESAKCHISGRCRGCPEGYIGARCQVRKPLQVPPHLQHHDIVKPTSIINQP